MKKRFIFTLIALLLLTPLCALLLSPQEATAKEVLSELSDQQLLEFLAAYEIEIPDEIESVENYIDGIRIWIVRTEENPAVRFQYGSCVLNDLSNEIKDAVNDYYGVSPQISPYSTSGYKLQDSTLYSWDPKTMKSYSCYGYAIGRNELLDPGIICGMYKPIGECTIYELAQFTKFDLESMGYACVSTPSTRPTSQSLRSGQTAICIRYGYDGDFWHDYHFMRLFGNVWRHKIGRTAVLTYTYLPSDSRIWLGEGVDDEGTFPGNYSYYGPIYYIVFGNTHAYSERYSGNEYHSGSRHYYEIVDGCDCGDQRSSRWISKPCSGPPRSTIMRDPELDFS